jgi:hypothetical protein
LVIGDSRDFGLGGPDRCPEDAGKFTIFLDEVLDKGSQDHPSFQSPITNHQCETMAAFIGKLPAEIVTINNKKLL